MTAALRIALRHFQTVENVKIYEADSTNWGRINIPASIHLLNPTEDELNNALDRACKNLFDSIVVYKKHQQRGE